MVKGICFVVLFVCIGVMIYSIINAFYVNKKNKKADEMSRQMFLAQINQDMKTDAEINENAEAKPVAVKQPFVSIEENKPKSLNYDEYNYDVDIESSNGKSLKDFYQAN